MVALAAAALVLVQGYSCPALEAEAPGFADAVMVEESQQYCPNLHPTPDDLAVIAALKEAAQTCGGQWSAFFAAIEQQSRAQATAHAQANMDAYCHDLSISTAR
jgi:hypothetical protein